MPNKSKVSLEDLEQKVKEAETLLASIKTELTELTGKPLPKPATQAARPQSAPPSVLSNIDGYVIEGQFDGQNMQGSDGKSYPVPANYASKSKLIPGDTLKLTVTSTGQFIYKQIGPVPRKQIVGDVIYENGAYKIQAEGKEYNVLLASITYFKAEVGDKVSIIVPSQGEAAWAAIENVVSGANVDASAQVNTLKIQEDKERIKSKEKDAVNEASQSASKKPEPENYTIDEL